MAGWGMGPRGALFPQVWLSLKGIAPLAFPSRHSPPLPRQEGPRLTHCFYTCTFPTPSTERRRAGWYLVPLHLATPHAPLLLSACSGGWAWEELLPVARDSHSSSASLTFVCKFLKSVLFQQQQWNPPSSTRISTFSRRQRAKEGGQPKPGSHSPHPQDPRFSFYPKPWAEDTCGA